MHIRVLLIFLLLGAFQSVWAKSSRLILCLAKEEQRFHTNKEIGPNYGLNQLFINEISSIGDLDLTKKYYHEVCTKSESPSLSLLEYLLLAEDNIFYFVNSSTSSLGRFQSSQVDDLKRRMPHIFFRYLSKLQTQVRDPHCLSRHIPGLSQLKEKFHYLEEDMGTRHILQNKKEIRGVLKKLKKFNSFSRNCQKSPYDRIKKRASKRASK